MPAKLIDGKKLADKILLQIKDKLAKMNAKPGLVAILIGDNDTSKLYLKLKGKACQETGINFHSYLLDDNCNEDKIIEVINWLNNDAETTGIIVQLPLPSKFKTDKIIQAIAPAKDVDGFQPKSKFISPNILGIIELLKTTKVNLKNKQIIILSNSKIFSQPFKKLLPNSKIEYINPQDKNLTTKTKTADILIVAIGQPYFIKPEMIKKDAILIDVGINTIKGKTVGDIDPACDKVAAWRSPVPGGVGPMTVAMLLKNLIKK
jgi:methylenetetrahydrofolate dehydrogenase (NADP+)/methenyltetrahydrofolate cyclohydrolase